ncbi:MAG: ABC transporter permease, partial [Corynebacterium sp.]|nr:ABC transporter permease [Corynebacterium sp.]
MNQTMIMAADWNRLGDTFRDAILDTLIMVSITMVVSGILGLIVGLLLYTTRDGGILKNKFVYTILNVLVNFVRPIPFIILIVAMKPLTVGVMGTSIGRDAGIFVM